MGGNTSKDKVRVLNQNVILIQERHNIESVDKTFKTGFIASTDIEFIRCEFIPLWNDFLKLSGGIVIRSPRFDTCIKAMFWKFACDMNGQLDAIELFEQEPFIRFKDMSIALPDDIQLARSFSELMTYVYRNDERVHMVASEMLKRMNRISDITRDPEKLFSSLNVPEIDLALNKNKLALNYRRLANANNIIVTIKTIFHHAKHGLHDFIDRIHYAEELRKMQNVGLEARRKNVTAATKIVYKYSMDEKYAAYEDYLDLIQEDKEAEKAARFYLSNLTKKMSEKINKSMTYSANNSVIVQEGIVKSNPIKVDIKIDEASSCDEQSESDCQSELDNQILIKQEAIKAKNEEIRVEVDGVKAQPIFVHHEDFKENIPTNISIKIQDDSALKKTSKVELLSKQLEDLQRNNEELMGRLSTFDNENIEIINSSQINPHIPEPKIVVVNSVPMHSSRRQITTVPAYEFPEVKIKINQNQIMNDFNEMSGNKLSWDIKQRFATIPTVNSAFLSVSSAKSNTFDYLIGGNKIGQLLIYSYPDLKEVKTLKVHTGAITCLLYLNDGRTLISGGSDGNIILHDLINLTFKNIASLKEPIVSLVNPLNGKSFFAAFGRSFIELDFLNYKNIFQLGAHSDQINSMLYNKDKEILVTCGDDCLIKIWDPTTKENIGVLEGHTGAIKDLAFGHVGQFSYLASIGDDKVITFWNLDDKDLTISFETEGSCKKVFYLPERQGFCTIQDNGIFYLWKVEKKENIKFINNIPLISGAGILNRGIVFGAENGSMLLFD